MQETVADTAPPSQNPTADFDWSSYVTVEGTHINFPPPPAVENSTPAPQRYRYPVTVSVRLVHPLPNNRGLLIAPDVVGYKASKDFWLSRGGESSVDSAADWSVDHLNVTHNLPGVEIVNWLVEHVSVPYSLRGVELFWHETPVDDWDSMAALVHGFLRRVTAAGLRGCGVNYLKITKYVSSPEEMRKALTEVRVMEVGKKVRVEKAIEMVTVEECGGGGGEEAVACGVCLGDLCDGTAVVGLAGCPHRFHEGCILEWFVQSMSCPLCRFRIQISAAADAARNNG
ncbi:unnamed protein product [Cuscuta campestris]|uniref:RING-type domain-containing protein n=1 Tax=Cuscuta campestris TaxID=132261 RepID=A0A484LGD8_9ASTE|nr:unnamed protein product [Cuscuta campestris]